MNYLQRDVRRQKLYVAITAVAVITMGWLAEEVSDHKLLPRYFQYSLAPGEHLKKIGQQGKANVYLVDAAGKQRQVGELVGRTKSGYSNTSALLSASFVIPTAIVLFLVWPRVPAHQEFQKKPAP